jgi:N-acetylmuramoyl-L-alanine amidase
MFAGRKTFHTRIAPASLVFAPLSLLLLGAFSTTAAEGTNTATTNGRRQAASTQFARGEDQRAALNARPAIKRTIAEYKQVVATYRRVYLITPHASEVPDALLAVAELYVEMGNHFGRTYYQSAVDSYRFLVREYPASRNAQDALLRIAQLEKDQLGDPALASKTYDEFVKKYPRSSHRREAQEARAELALLQNGDAPASAKNAPAGNARVSAKTEEPIDAGRDRVTREGAALPSSARAGGAALVRSISTSAAEESTRVTIELDDAVEYSSARIRNPDRIFFDLHAARLTPGVANGNIRVEGDLLTAVRVAQNHAGIVRVVLDVTEVQEYTASLLNNPPELVIDLYAESRPAQSAKAKHAQRQEVAPVNGEAAAAEATGRTVGSSASEKASPGDAWFSPGQPASGSAVGARGTSAIDGSAAANVPPGAVRTLPSGNAGARSKSTKSVSSKPDLIQSTATAQPTRDGQATLTRTLGLKIGRIVIDAGHGGHDTGTIGPTGLMEKDLCLDVALRLGKIIQQRLPGADVMYTRSDDSFIPLEERTHIANEARADLFISIHANSSHDHDARGIETYYLNLKGSPDAMEVAARENATAQESVHDLEDLVKKIARSEKIDESREFAADIQESLAKRIQKSYKPVKDRGVRKAPFVVLIGADMPSILTEISFLSNPADEQLLKKPEHRQRVAEGLYQGVASYLQSLNSVTVNLPKLPPKPANRSSSVASVEQTRNPQ